VPIFVVIIYLFHPLLGAIALAGALVLFGLAYLNEKLSRKPLESMQLEARKAGRFADHSVGNAEVGGALGMVDNLSRGSQALSRGGLALQLQAGMPAEVFIQTTPRSPLQYLLDPIAGFLQRSMREH
jgi:ABC-type protease/lipase transport system fused ATPase/permease subunit